MDPRQSHHGGIGIRHLLSMMLGCCLAFLLLLVLAPFAGAWGIVLVVVALLGCGLMAVLHHHGSRRGTEDS